MTAGVPGLGLSGLFVMLTAIAMPLWRVRGKTSRVRPVRVRSILLLAALIGAATWLVWQALSIVSERVAGTHRHGHANFGSLFGVPVILISLALLAAIIGAAEVAARVLPARPTPKNPPVPSVRTAARRDPTAIATTKTTVPAPRATPAGDNTIDARCRELADACTQLRSARQQVANTHDRILERFDPGYSPASTRSTNSSQAGTSTARRALHEW